MILGHRKILLPPEEASATGTPADRKVRACPVALCLDFGVKLSTLPLRTPVLTLLTFRGILPLIYRGWDSPQGCWFP